MMDEIVQLRQRVALLQAQVETREHEMREAARGEERARVELKAARVVVEAARQTASGPDSVNYGGLCDALATYDATLTPAGA